MECFCKCVFLLVMVVLERKRTVWAGQAGRQAGTYFHWWFIMLEPQQDIPFYFLCSLSALRAGQRSQTEGIFG